MTGRAWGVIAVLAIGIVVGIALWLRLERTPPRVEAPAELVLGRSGQPLRLVARDVGSGVRRLRVHLRHAEGEAPLFEEEYPGSLLTGGLMRPEAPAVETVLDARKLGLPEGEAFLVVEASDWSWAHLLQGNTTQLEIPVHVDLTAPRLAVLSGLTYVRRGGSAAVVYEVGPDARRHGAMVGDFFFAGSPLPSRGKGVQVALFGVPRDAGARAKMRVVAIDGAGNRRERSWATRLQERTFDEVPIRLGRSFLEEKVRDLAEVLRDRFEIPDDPIAAFQVINREVRAANEEEIRRIVARTRPERRFRGAFLQMRNSAVTSRFAEHRSYFVDGRKISEAIHYGYDLASTGGAPVEAANAGRVLFADALGIYGNCVILDHGLGLTSLYAHLSRIDVGVDDEVSKGQEIGTSGSTGLAGGDHLHFAILVSGTYVDPQEWWDARWVREHVEERLEGQPTAP